jgi:short-subunit dehydrogenase
MSRGVVLVTGASSGIGAEFARQLGAEGLDLVLVARRADRLEALRGEIAGKFGVRCHLIVCDLSRAESPRQVFDETEALGLEVDWLINNAGFGTDGPFSSLRLEREIEQIQLNVTTPVLLAHLYLSGMVARKRGKIINLGSVGAFVPTPYMATYSGTKAFILSFSEALACELSGTGVAVLVLCPGATKTEFHEVAGASGTLPEFSFMSAEAVVRQAIAAARSGKHTFVPGWMNKAVVASTRFTPRRVLAQMAGAMFHPKAG